MEHVARLRARPLELLRETAGTPAEFAGKLQRLAQTISRYADCAGLDVRLARLVARGHIAQVPSRVQLAAGALDMMRFWISPAAAEYYRQMGINYAFHQVLRFLDEPASVADPIGLFSTRDGIIGHLMQVVHANPLYDLQLLDMFPDGMGELETQLTQMIAGTHPRARAISAIVEESDYHPRLLAYVRAFRVDRRAQPPLRSNVAASRHFARVERTFGSLTGAMAYFCTLPSTVSGAVRHLRTVSEFPAE